MEIANFWGRAILAFIFVLGVMIFVHELGHYLVAKLLKIRVDVFSLGFGPRLFGFKRGDTDYRVSALPLGGYVKMSGESYEDELTGGPDEFLSRSKPQRFAVAVAGPLMNIALALFLTWANFWYGVEVDAAMKQPPTLGRIEAGSPAAKAGLQINDTVTSVDGRKTQTWRDLVLEVGQRPNQTAELKVRRGDQVVTTSVTFGNYKDAGTLGADPPRPFVVASVESGRLAAKAGMQPGDTILQVTAGGKSASHRDDIITLINASEGKPVLLKVQRKGQLLEKTVVPVKDKGEKVARIGIANTVLEVERFGFFESWKQAVKRNYQVTLLTFNVLGRIITGRASLRQMSGPIEIARFSGAAAEQGAFVLLQLMALISLQLGIFNLLPIPILDGGVIALLAVEGLMRRDLSLRVKERIFQIGFIFLIVLMGIIIINDITKQIPTS